MTKQECYEFEARDQYLLDSYWLLEEAAVRENEPEEECHDRRSED